MLNLKLFKIMKKILSAAALAGLLVLPVIGLAVEEPSEIAPTIVTTGAELITKIEYIGNWIFTVLLAIAAIFLIIAGVMWLGAAGNPEGITKARTMLINSLIGLAIALFAKGMVAVIKSIIGS